MSAQSQNSPPLKDWTDHPPMDHLLVYLQHGLSQAAMEKLRAHLVACPSCRDLLLEAEAFAPERDPEVSEDSRQAAWARLQARRSSAAGDAPIPVVLPADQGSWQPPVGRRALGGSFAQIAAMLVLVLAAGILAIHQFRAQQGVLVTQRARLDEQNRELATLGHALEEARQETERVQRLLAIGSGTDPSSTTNVPTNVLTLETSVSALDLLPGSFSRQGVAERSRVSRLTEFLYINLHLPSSEQFTEFRLTIKGPDQRTLLSVPGLTTTPLGTVGFLLSTAVLATGSNELVLEGLGAGLPREVERYALEVVDR